MANGLEKLFSKRRPSPISAPAPGPENKKEPASAGSPEPAAGSQPMFPSPSFIRPKASRMVARSEGTLTTQQQAARRAQSLPEPQTQPLQPSGTHSHKPSSASTTHLRYASQSQRHDSESICSSSTEPAFAMGLQEFSFSPRTSSGAVSPTSLASSAISPRNTRHLFGQPSPTQDGHFLPPRADTPPASDQEDDARNVFRNKKLPALPPRVQEGNPTPEPSPELLPVTDSRITDPREELDILGASLYMDIQQHLDSSRASGPLRRAASQSSLMPSPCSTSGDSILAEPTFNDFMNLSDDDIAESMPEPLNLPPNVQLPPSPPSTASSHSRKASSLLTLTPPCASRPATAAAFEAARIAAKYNFDLVYVVNLWPNNATADLGSPLPSPTRPSRAGLTGRLLAAYGLSAVKSPFRISAGVHAKILRSDGWIEYRNQDAHSDEFARGYASAFYTGQFGRRGSAESARHPAHKQQIDRGIVFAAYRKPSTAGQNGVGCNPDELGELHREAEALVEMLIDIHVAHRLRQPAAHCDETGPMPPLRPNTAAYI